MKLSSAFFTVIAGLCLLATAQTAQAVQEEELEFLLDAIAQVESNNNPDAVGDGGRAIGAYQIHRPYWQDGIRVLGVDWDYQDATDPHKAKQVVRAYLCHYGGDVSLLDMARIHNGGPNGHKKEATLEYSRKVEAILADMMQAP